MWCKLEFNYKNSLINDRILHNFLFTLPNTRGRRLHGLVFVIMSQISLMLQNLRLLNIVKSFKKGTWNFFLSCFLTVISAYVLIAGVEGYCCTWSHSVTHLVGLLRTRESRHTKVAIAICTPETRPLTVSVSWNTCSSLCVYLATF